MDIRSSAVVAAVTLCNFSWGPVNIVRVSAAVTFALDALFCLFLIGARRHTYVVTVIQFVTWAGPRNIVKCNSDHCT